MCFKSGHVSRRAKTESQSDALSELSGNVLRGYPHLHLLLQRGGRPTKPRKIMELSSVTLTNVQVSFSLRTMAGERLLAQEELTVLFWEY